MFCGVLKIIVSLPPQHVVCNKALITYGAVGTPSILLLRMGSDIFNTVVLENSEFGGCIVQGVVLLDSKKKVGLG